MKEKNIVIRACVLFRFFKQHYPNFRDEIPHDECYEAFYRLTGLTLSTFENNYASWKMLGLLKKEGLYLKAYPETIEQECKAFGSSEKKTIKEQLEKLEKTIKATGAKEKYSW